MGRPRFDAEFCEKIFECLARSGLRPGLAGTVRFELDLLIGRIALQPVEQPVPQPPPDLPTRRPSSPP
jgi:hypothetical protein